MGPRLGRSRAGQGPAAGDAGGRNEHQPGARRPAAGDQAMPDGHPLAGRDVIDFADLLDEPFLALPQSAGPLRDYWLAVDARGGRPPLIGAEIASTDETYEALVDGRGVCLLAAGNAPLISLGGVTTRPVHGIAPSQLALAWRFDDTRPLVLGYAQACREAIHS
jgi:DNA-binding transcriptional LysR family regulator